MDPGEEGLGKRIGLLRSLRRGGGGEGKGLVSL